MRILLASIGGAIAIAVGVFGGLYLWGRYQAPSAELIAHCETWAKARGLQRAQGDSRGNIVDRECVGVYP